jgi:hypothetical protein
MLIWAAMLFFLGVFSFLDSFFNYGEIFRRVNSVMFMLIALGLLIGIRSLRKQSKEHQSGSNLTKQSAWREMDSVVHPHK